MGNRITNLRSNPNEKYTLFQIYYDLYSSWSGRNPDNLYFGFLRLIQKKILEETGESLYKEAISIASYQANADYTDPTDVEASYNMLKLRRNTRIPVL